MEGRAAPDAEELGWVESELGMALSSGWAPLWIWVGEESFLPVLFGERSPEDSSSLSSR